MRIISFNLALSREHDKIKDLILGYMTPDTIICFQEVSGSMYLFFEQYLRRDLPVDTKIFATPLHAKVHKKIQYQSILIPPQFVIQDVDMIRCFGFEHDPNKYILKVRFADDQRKYTIFNVHGYVRSILAPMEALNQVFKYIDNKRENLIVGDFNLNLSWFRKYLRKRGIVELSHAVRESFIFTLRDAVERLFKVSVGLHWKDFRLIGYKTDAVLIKSHRKFTYHIDQVHTDFSDHDLIVLDIEYKNSDQS